MMYKIVYIKDVTSHPKELVFKSFKSLAETLAANSAIFADYFNVVIFKVIED